MLEINLSQFPIITSGRLLLRQLCPEDARYIYRIRSNDEVIQFMDTKKMDHLEEAESFLRIIEDSWQKQSGITWGITVKDNTEVIGTIGYWRLMKEHYRAEIGYGLHPEYWGRGFMLESMKAVIEFGFNTLKLHSIEANVNPSNVSSIKLLERTGFVKEAYFRENFYFNGKFLDSAIYSLIAPA